MSLRSVRWLPAFALPTIAILLPAIALWYVATLGTESVFNYRLTVTLEYKGRTYEGEGVWQMKSWLPTVRTTDTGVKTEVRGEAIPIEVDSLGVLHFLKRSASNVSILNFGDFPFGCDAPGGQRSVEEHIEALEGFVGPCSGRDFTPIVARLLREAPYFEVVSTSWKGDGPCNALCVVSVIATGTDLPITTGLPEQFPWLSDAKGPSAIIIGTEDISLSKDEYLRQDFSTEP